MGNSAVRTTARAFQSKRPSIGHVLRGATQPIIRTEKTMSTDREKIRALNDDLRRHLYNGGVFMTPGIAALGEEAIGRLANAIATFDDFCNANDPHGEHDFGTFDFDGAAIIFKIDYYDKDRNFHSPDPADPNVTERVITIMLAEEY
jgi:hypothetical protein